MELIVLDSQAFYALLEEVLKHFQNKEKEKEQKWLNQKQTMDLLHIRSLTTLQKWRDQGKIRFSQIDKKTILYDSDSIRAFLDKNAKEPF